MLQINQFFRKNSCVVLLICAVLFICGWISTTYFLEARYQNQKLIELNKIVQTGMDIDVATILLKKKGFSVGQRHTPIGLGSTEIIHFRLFDKLSLIDNATEALGLPWSPGPGYATLKIKNNMICDIIPKSLN